MGLGIHPSSIGSRADRAGPDVGFRGESPAIRTLSEIAAGVAARHCTVMILGETGSGKEMLARFIHSRSGRAGKPFIPVDCSTLSDGLFESELFGHVRGAFTGAVRDALGFVRAADGGTLFLDEIGELTPALQAKLLRVVQERTIVPVGDTRPRRVDVRIIAATHRDLQAMVRAETFRQDLFFRLNVVVLHLPPLRQRPEDVLPLARHFLGAQAALYGEAMKRLSPETAELLGRYDWPGNVRELANAMEHAHVLASDETIEPADLPPRLRERTGGVPAGAGELRLEQVERQTIAEALKRTNFNKAAASRMLGINVQRLARRIARLDIRLP